MACNYARNHRPFNWSPAPFSIEKKKQTIWTFHFLNPTRWNLWHNETHNIINSVGRTICRRNSRVNGWWNSRISQRSRGTAISHDRVSCSQIIHKTNDNKRAEGACMWYSSFLVIPFSYSIVVVLHYSYTSTIGKRRRTDVADGWWVVTRKWTENWGCDSSLFFYSNVCGYRRGKENNNAGDFVKRKAQKKNSQQMIF